MNEFVIRNRAGLDNRFVKIQDESYDDGHYKVYKNTGKDYFLITPAMYIREIHDDSGNIIGIDPEGGLPTGILSIGDKINGMTVKEIKILPKACPVHKPISNIVIIFE